MNQLTFRSSLFQIVLLWSMFCSQKLAADGTSPADVLQASITDKSEIVPHRKVIDGADNGRLFGSQHNDTIVMPVTEKTTTSPWLAPKHDWSAQTLSQLDGPTSQAEGGQMTTIKAQLAGQNPLAPDEAHQVGNMLGTSNPATDNPLASIRDNWQQNRRPNESSGGTSTQDSNKKHSQDVVDSSKSRTYSDQLSPNSVPTSPTLEATTSSNSNELSPQPSLADNAYNPRNEDDDQDEAHTEDPMDHELNLTDDLALDIKATVSKNSASPSLKVFGILQDDFLTEATDFGHQPSQDMTGKMNNAYAEVVDEKTVTKGYDDPVDRLFQEDDLFDEVKAISIADGESGWDSQSRYHSLDSSLIPRDPPNRGKEVEEGPDIDSEEARDRLEDGFDREEDKHNDEDIYPVPQDTIDYVDTQEPEYRLKEPAATQFWFVLDIQPNHKGGHLNSSLKSSILNSVAQSFSSQVDIISQEGQTMRLNVSLDDLDLLNGDEDTFMDSDVDDTLDTESRISLNLRNSRGSQLEARIKEVVDRILPKNLTVHYKGDLYTFRKSDWTSVKDALYLILVIVFCLLPVLLLILGLLLSCSFLYCSSEPASISHLLTGQEEDAKILQLDDDEIDDEDEEIFGRRRPSRADAECSAEEPGGQNPRQEFQPPRLDWDSQGPTSDLLLIDESLSEKARELWGIQPTSDQDLERGHRGQKDQRSTASYFGLSRPKWPSLAVTMEMFKFKRSARYIDLE